MIRRASITAIGLTLLLAGGRARADNAPEVVNEVGATEIFIGESVDYFIEIRNVKNPTAPDVSALRQEFEVVANGDESRNQLSTLIINGRVSQQNVYSHVYRYRLTPKRAGHLLIPAPKITIDGNPVSGSSLVVDVQAPEKQDLVLPEIKTDRQKVYPTQPFEVALRILVQPLPNDSSRDPVSPLRRQPPHIDVNWVELPAGLKADDKSRWLEKLLADNGSGFTLNDVTTQSGSFFGGSRPAVFDLAKGRESHKGQDGRTINYFVYELKRTIVPEKAGPFVLGPAVIKGTFVSGLNGENYTGRRLVAVAPAVQIDVREVPSPRPATFCGGIGSYRVSASASPSTLRVGDPLTLKLDIARERGSGSLDLIAAPDLTAIPALASEFDIVDQHPVGRSEGDAKHFEYALRPKRAGVAIPPLAVTVFDPDRESFSEITTEPIALSVTNASRLNANDLVGSVTPTRPEAIKAKEQGIFQNATDPSELTDERVNLPALGAVAAVGWLLAGGLMIVITSHRRKSGDIVWQRKRNARRAASRKLADARSAMSDGQPRDALRLIRSALTGLIADLRNVVGEGLTASEADGVLATSAVLESDREAFSRLLAAIESAEYGSAIPAEIPALVDSAETLLPRLARHLERGL